VDALALTFDGGPGAVTPALLDLLAGHGARATFVLGQMIARGRAT
jgi:peptidoglycan/xylan/chitin deacetylase (PgdA/CDA1 family)